MTYRQLVNTNVAGQRVLIRADMNVPLRQDGTISDATRIEASLPSIEYCLQQGAMSVTLMTHLGRPKEGSSQAQDSVLPIADELSHRLGLPIHFLQGPIASIPRRSHGVAMLENVRLNVGEKSNDPKLSQDYAQLCDVFVHDAFGTAHRMEASTYGVAQFAPIACAGLLLHQEMMALKLALAQPKRPLLAIVAGAKISTKLSILKALSKKADQLIVGGGIANTFLLAAGYPIGASLVEVACVKEAKTILDDMHAHHKLMPLPSDVVVAKSLSTEVEATTKPIQALLPDEKILDIGPDSIAALMTLIRQAKTIIWNGPIGAFEFAPFSHGTRALAKAIVDSDAFSLAGGGETVAAVRQFKMADGIGYLSTGGGAFLAFLEGKTLPAIAILDERLNA